MQRGLRHVHAAQRHANPTRRAKKGGKKCALHVVVQDQLHAAGAACLRGIERGIASEVGAGGETLNAGV